MNTKTEYVIPELTVITLTEAEVITTSFEGENGFDGKTDDNW